MPAGILGTWHFMFLHILMPPPWALDFLAVSRKVVNSMHWVKVGGVVGHET
jgi:hypothetical protein